MQHRKALVWLGVLGFGVSGAATAQLGKPSAPREPAPSKAPAAAEAPSNPAAGEIRTAHDLLVALEKAGQSIDTLQATVVYDRRFRLQGDRHIRRGTLLFQNIPAQDGSGANPTRTFAILFKSLQIGGERLEQSPQTWVFDGRWLVEIRENEKQFIKREIARPGEPFDPLKIGEGPMPIPIGQEAAEIERRYHAELMEPRSGLPPTWSVPAWLEDTWQVSLTPKRADDDEFTSIRLWYEKSSLLPRMAITVNRAGDESIVFLNDVVRNEPLPTGRLAASEPPPNSGWTVQVERLPETDGNAGDDR